MKGLPAGLQAHLDSGSTTMVFCWRVSRQDGEVQGFTEHDNDLTFLGTTFLASAGFTASRIQQKLGLSVDNLTLQGAIDSDTINEDDLAAGRYDDASVELFWVNFEDVSQRLLVSKGSIGEVKRMETAFEAEFRSLAHRLGQRTGRTYQRYCDATLGDSRCKVNLNTPTFRGTGTVVSASGRNLVLDGIGSYANGWFLHGTLEMTSGACDGLTFEVKGHTGGNVQLWQLPPLTITAGDGFRIRAGCKQDNVTCRTKFNNLLNYQGFPFMPGNDVVQRYPTQGEDGMNGGSLGLGRDVET